MEELGTLNLQQLVERTRDLPPPVERYVNRMVVEIQEIVVSLGYQRPEEVINAYANHVPMDLAKKDMLFQLLQKLREVIETKKIPSEFILERARELFGEDCLNDKAIHMMEEKFKAAGVNVEFELPDIEVPYDEGYIEEAFKDREQGKARFFVRRPEFMVVNGVRQPITLLSLKLLFKSTTGTTLNPFGTGDVVYNDEGRDWYDSEVFAQAPMKGGYAMPTKEVIPGSTNKNWDDQQALLGPDERRREAVETAWDLILYYATTGKKLLENIYDWGNAVWFPGSMWPSGGRVYIGYFNNQGFTVHGNTPGDTDNFVGMCSSK